MDFSLLDKSTVPSLLCGSVTLSAAAEFNCIFWNSEFYVSRVCAGQWVFNVFLVKIGENFSLWFSGWIDSTCKLWNSSLKFITKIVRLAPSTTVNCWRQRLHFFHSLLPATEQHPKLNEPIISIFQSDSNFLFNVTSHWFLDFKKYRTFSQQFFSS